MKRYTSGLGVTLALAIAMLLGFLYYVRPPGLPPQAPPGDDTYLPDFANEGELPGVTWVDDIHPIFTRNICVRCHIRGQEAIAEGFEEFALGLVDPRNKQNAFWSYHELVYAEGPPQVQKGEVNRDGQCCWPRGSPPEHQRRIWLGHPGRSAIVRKLEHDYYDWRKPPRFFEEGIALRWGLPMPMYYDDREHDPEEARYFEIRPFYERILLHLSLWLGESEDELRPWPPQIPAKDRALLRYWISNAMQVMEEGTGFEIEVLDPSGSPAEEAVVRLVGNYNSPEVRAVADEIAVETDKDGIARLSFPRYSVITTVWHMSARHKGSETGYVTAIVESGKTTRIRLMLPPPERSS